ncbi:MAG TPA: hypothetical protein VJ299_17320 [Steroidobacteraceae bacterium]|jgi:hypothetical protein|nr:hypothetical protein [Steroidobacteraceae bacterium]HJY39239.1 hypothetical protein [Steroidobacteraceae bacterium]
MSQKTASRTALATDHMCAAHQLLDPPPRILGDPVAVAVLGPGAEQRIRELAHRSQAPERRALSERRHLVAGNALGPG